MSLWSVFRWAVLAIALAPLVYYLLILYAARRFFSRRVAPADFTPPLSVLKPVRGLDHEAYENFASYCRQDYPDYEILFAVPDESDASIPVIRQIMSDFPERRIRLLVGSKRLGTNDKVNKLCRMAREARADILVVSDSDVRVAPDHLRTIAAAFRDRETGAATCLYRGSGPDSFGTMMEVLGSSSEFQPGVLAAWLLEGVKFTLGATMAVRREALEAIGGFEALTSHYSDDFEMGHRIAARGYRVELIGRPVVVVFSPETVGECFRHQVRWALTTRHSRPWGHVGLVLTFGLPWSIAAALAAPAGPISVAYLAGYLALRTASAWAVGVRGLDDQVLRRKLWLLPVRDTFGFAVWLASFFRRRIVWRGSAFTIRNQRLVPGDPSELAATAAAPTDEEREEEIVLSAPRRR
jgi:ceramide glucosyltransferase